MEVAFHDFLSIVFSTSRVIHVPLGEALDLGALAPRKISEEGEFRNWASTQQSAPARVYRPTSVDDIEDILAEVRIDSLPHGEVKI